ncbi:MAG: hydrogenase [Deltaproteobacteria bacterium CG_4_10_14_3_um_filter_60_8]|nr:MAG: hydrogenase [Desulfobacterales bacterium CG2_30_60_27]PIP43323.1 MAG: hydrogenase [Deltaproteobacteria bacterium CG23_combo_of_CG06-09_8_20_14_all_60_8]PIY20843.1 MAG: hydrogenase [Deltaproteobacteria bacterium CG_4_10_14_3_um_filter_60_8]
MFRVIAERFRQGYRTGKFPRQEPVLPEPFRGLPVVSPGCPEGCRACVQNCPFEACAIDAAGQVTIDLGRCLFCADCPACRHGRIGFSRDYRLAVRNRDDLIMKPGQELALAERLGRELHRLFGRSLQLRVVSAGGCNACEADCNVLGTLVYDLGRFGISFVASPRHADGILVTGPVTEHMRAALLATYEAVPAPKIVIAVGACAIGGGPFRGSPEVSAGLDSLLPVDLFIPGCPPQPYTILDGLLRLLGKR